MSYVYSREDNEIASSIEQRISAMRRYRTSLRNRRLSGGSRQSQEVSHSGDKTNGAVPRDKDLGQVLADVKIVDEPEAMEGSLSPTQKPEE